MDLGRAYDGMQGFPHWIIARRQTRARGRQGRAWLSDQGAFSATCLLAPNCTAQEAALYSFVTACALRRALADLTDENRLSQKWPNDVLLDGGKVAGILLETAGMQGPHITRLLIGIGVNLGPAPVDVQDAAFSPVGMGCTMDPVAFLHPLAQHMQNLTIQFQTHGFAPIRREWLNHAARIGETITARTAKGDHTGVFEGIDDLGQLILLTQGAQIAIPAADVYF